MNDIPPYFHSNGSVGLYWRPENNGAADSLCMYASARTDELEHKGGDIWKVHFTGAKLISWFKLVNDNLIIHREDGPALYYITDHIYNSRPQYFIDGYKMEEHDILRRVKIKEYPVLKSLYEL